MRNTGIDCYDLIIYGTSDSYDKYFEKLIVGFRYSNVRIIGFFCTNYTGYRMIDCIPILEAEDILNLEFDYIINICNDIIYNQSLNILSYLKVDNSKIIPGYVFSLPCFEWNRYIKLRKKVPSIISHHCFAGFLYNSLGIQFQSPFINLFLNKSDIGKVYTNLRYYLEQQPIYVRDEYEPNLRRNYPVLKLDDVLLFCNHYIDADEAISAWNRRVDRVDYDNLLFEMVIEDDEDIRVFEQLQGNRVGFSSIDYRNERVIWLPYKNDYYRNEFQCLSQMVNLQVSRNIIDLRAIDVFKLLCGEKDFIRAIR